MSSSIEVTKEACLEDQDCEQGRDMAVLAVCRIKVGYVCTIYYPTHGDVESFCDHERYHEQSAEVIKVRKDSLDIRVTSGPRKGDVLKETDPTELFFWGPFTSKTNCG